MPTRARTEDLFAGLVLGGAAGLFWLFIYVVPLLGVRSELLEEHGFLIILAGTLGAWFAAGAAFGLLVRRRVGRGSRVGVALAGGAAFLMASFIGMVGAGMAEDFAVGRGMVDPSLLPIVFAVSFAVYLAGAVLVVTAAVGLVTRATGALRCALLAGALTGLVYLSIALALNLLPGWRVGGGQRAMIKVALAANLVTGTVGGVTSIMLLGRAARLARPDRSRPPGMAPEHALHIGVGPGP